MRYLGRHDDQFDGSALANQNCHPQTIANGLRSTTGGRIDLTGGKIRSLVAQSEETNPTTPGWSLKDGRLAVSRISSRLGISNVPQMIIKSGTFADVERDRLAGYFICAQGDSDRFPDGTCSGKFDGNHSTGLHPNGLITLGDPICLAWRTETPFTIKAYMEKFAGGTSLEYAVFDQVVPEVAAEMHYGKTLTQLFAPNPRSFTIPAGVLVNGYDPNKPGTVVKSFKKDDGPSSAWAVADAAVAWYNPDGTPAGSAAPIPRGSGFLQVASGAPGGALAGLLIVKSLVILAPATPTVTQQQLDEAVAANEQKWENWVVSHP